ncbi:MAG: 5'/3'-nucleotidase SurE [Prevotellaceae bacterium]|jgi:5'-nucleotidase|nr:5'/3'-nucleotidase SurE [Prevotellaceae bacterium]
MRNNKPLIFITNDDSIYAKGIEALIEMVRPIGDLFVVASTESQSCMSHAVTLKNPLRAHKMREEKGLVVYGCNGTPVDCVKLGLSELVTSRPSLLLSGINHGANSSINAVYSGTVAAAAEGIFYCVPSIAFSLCSHSSDADFSGSIAYGRKIVEQTLNKGLPENICLNVNFPKLPLERIEGIRLCRQNRGAWAESIERRIDPHNREYYWLDGGYVNHEPESTDTDEAALASGYISVVPLHFDYTAYEALNYMKTNWSDFEKESKITQ